MPELQAPPRLRLFVAISLPDDVKARILAAQQTLRDQVSRALVRWARPDQFHLTLRFLGDVDSAQVPDLAGSLASACRRFAPLRLTAAGIGFFPGPRSPRVVWAGISDEEENLVPLHEAVQEASTSFTGEEPESRFKGHITVGRIKGMRPQEVERLASTAARFSGSPFGEWIASDVHLIRSELSPDGARYTVLEAFALASAT